MIYSQISFFVMINEFTAVAEPLMDGELQLACWIFIDLIFSFRFLESVRV